MKTYLLIGIILLSLFVIGCTPEEVPVSTDDKEVQSWEISDSLEFCLREYVYGKTANPDKGSNWVNLAEEHCEPLLPDGCLFGYGKGGYRETGSFSYNGRSTDGFSSPIGGKFGIYCPAEYPKELSACNAKINWSSFDDPLSGTDGFIIRTLYENCWYFIPNTCMFVNTVRGPYHNMFFCLITS